MAHLQLIYLLKMVIFHSYANLPEGNLTGIQVFAIKMAGVSYKIAVPIQWFMLKQAEKLWPIWAGDFCSTEGFAIWKRAGWMCYLQPIDVTFANVTSNTFKLQSIAILCSYCMVSLD